MFLKHLSMPLIWQNVYWLTPFLLGHPLADTWLCFMLWKLSFRAICLGAGTGQLPVSPSNQYIQQSWCVLCQLAVASFFEYIRKQFGPTNCVCELYRISGKENWHLENEGEEAGPWRSSSTYSNLLLALCQSCWCWVQRYIQPGSLQPLWTSCCICARPVLVFELIGVLTDWVGEASPCLVPMCKQVDLSSHSF